MNKAFMHKVINNGVVDTRKYRYIYEIVGKRGIIKRLALSDLDTTEALTGWMVVRVVWASL